MGAVREEIEWRAARRALAGIGGDLSVLRNKKICVTGSTGLVGSQIVRVLIEANVGMDLGLKLVLPVRSVGRAANHFGDCAGISLVPWELGEEPDLGGACDLFVHCACPTSSRAFAEQPVETLLAIVDGTAACLRSAREAGCGAFVYLSTMEVYGEPAAKPATETDLGPTDPTLPRSSYPVAKLAAENLVASSGEGGDMRTASLRLAQTFGAGVRRDDGRVFAEFARCATAGEDITLLSDGSKRNCYLSVSDAASAVLTVLASDAAAGAYNAANPGTYCSIREMAELVLSRFGVVGSQVRFGSDPVRAAMFRKGDDILLDCTKLRSLGWEPSEGLEEMYRQMIESWKL